MEARRLLASVHGASAARPVEKKSRGRRKEIFAKCTIYVDLCMIALPQGSKRSQWTVTATSQLGAGDQ